MKIEIIRQRSEDWGTPGRLTVVDTGFQCDTLELPWLDNRKGVSCIIADTYALRQWFSPTFKRMVLRLEDKHGRADCLIHPTNFAGRQDLGLYTQLHGCTAPGRGYGQLARPDGGGMQMAILRSGATLTELMENIGVGVHQLTYRWADGCAP